MTTGSPQFPADPLAHWIIAARKVIGVVRMQTLDPCASATDATTRLRSIPVNTIGIHRGQQCITLCRVSIMCRLQYSRIDGTLGVVHSPRRFEMTDVADLIRPGQPIQRRHRRSVIEVGGVLDDNGNAVRIADDDRKSATRAAAQQLCDCLDIGSRGGQFQGLTASQIFWGTLDSGGGGTSVGGAMLAGGGMRAYAC